MSRNTAHVLTCLITICCYWSLAADQDDDFLTDIDSALLIKALMATRHSLERRSSSPARQANTTVHTEASAARLREAFSLLSMRPSGQCERNGDTNFAFFCPTPHLNDFSAWTCIRPDQLCNGIPDCPNVEDEDPTDCMFFVALQHHNQMLRKIIVDHYEHHHIDT